MSRRAWLGLAGSSAALASPGLKTLGSLYLDRFDAGRQGKRLEFRLRGTTRWIIDPDRFAGKPRLSVHEGESTLLVTLEGARFPGTAIPADFHCRISSGQFTSRIEIHFAFAHLHGEGSFEPWLAGMGELRLDGKARLDAVTIHRAGVFRLQGDIEALFSPDWYFDLSGEGPGTLDLPHVHVVANECRLALSSGNESSALRNPAVTRSALSIRRAATSAWWVRPPSSDSRDISFSSETEPFDSIDLECSESRRGARQYAVVADTSTGDAVLLSRLTSRDGAIPFGGDLPLVSPRLAVGYLASRTEGVLVARFGDRRTWLRADHVHVEVGGGGAAERFEVRWIDGTIASLRCAPALFRTLAPLPDAVVEPSPVGPDRFLPLHLSAGPGGTQQKVQAKQSVQVVAANPLLLNNRVSALRPEDFVRIDFEFRNLKIQGGEAPVLVKDKPGPSYVIVHFPPQNIAESAYFEADNTKFPIKAVPGKPPDPDMGKTASDTPPDPPVPTRVAGPSRLVFFVPDEIPSLEYSLKGLLGAFTGLPLSVSAPAAALTKEQQAFLKQSQRMTRVRGGVTAAKGTVASLRTLLGKAPSQSSQTSVRSGLVSLDEHIQVMREAPAGLLRNASVRKRIETLSNAVSEEAHRDPSLAAEYSASLERLLTGVEAHPALEALAPRGPGGVILALLKPAEPSATETSLELPYRLVVSPNSYGGWIHSPEAIEWNGRTELWHTRLGIRSSSNSVTDGMVALRTVRAVWSPDYVADPHAGPGHLPLVPFRMALDRQDRHEIVHLTSNFLITGFEPLPVRADLLMLSSLGAWINVVGDWIPPATAGLSVEHWRNRGTMGRDHFVRVVYAGFLYPFGHRASLIKITERKFQIRKFGFFSKPLLVAYLRQRMYIVIKEREKAYPGPGQASLTGGAEARRMPFRRVRITTLATPNLDKPENNCVGTEGQSAFWPFVDGSPFPFHCTGEDWEGRISEFSAAMLFVDQGVAFNANKLSASQKEYAKWDKRRESDLQGQRVAFADPTTPGDTSFETDSVTFGGEINVADIQTLAKDIDPPFYPTVDEAAVHIAPAEQLLGNSSSPQKITLDTAYVTNGFDGNKNRGEVFAALKNPFHVDFSGDSRRTGGLITPSMGISGLSRKIGAFGGTVAQIAKGNFQPEDYFKAALSDAKFLGGIPLYTLLEAIPDFSKSAARVPRLVRESSLEFLRTTLTWTPQLRTSGAKAGSSDEKFTGIFVPNDPLGLTVTVDVRAPLTGAAPQTTVQTAITNFSLHLIPQIAEFMIIDFKKAVFTITPGNKTDIGVDIKDLQFAGALSFVNQILSVIDKSGFKDPPSLEVTPAGITAGYSLAVPTVAVGAFSLQNITLNGQLTVPFDGSPLSVGFAFCTRENPFLLTVSLFGGGGFFGIAVTPKGVDTLEASLEFGGAFALNLGVAKGGVMVMGGFYYMKSSDVTDYNAYVRMSGGLAVLGLITVSVEFYLGLTYASNGKMEGTATVSVKIEIAFFSKTVGMTVTRQFKGSAGDPLFKDTMSSDDFAKYLAAFASE
jgi:hypothetical protein